MTRWSGSSSVFVETRFSGKTWRALQTGFSIDAGFRHFLDQKICQNSLLLATDSHGLTRKKTKKIRENQCKSVANRYQFHYNITCDSQFSGKLRKLVNFKCQASCGIQRFVKMGAKSLFDCNLVKNPRKYWLHFMQRSQNLVSEPIRFFLDMRIKNSIRLISF